MYKIGLTGGIASGKSTVVDMLRQEGACVVDCDILAREVVAPGTVGLQQVVNAFGEHVLREDKSLNRDRLGKLVFGNEVNKERLERILFPLIFSSLQAKMQELARLNCKLVFLDMPLLFEVNYQTQVDEVWVVYVPRDIQLHRLMLRNGYEQKEAEERIHSQWTMDKKIKLASVIIDNQGSLEDTRKQIKQQWVRLQREIV